MAITFRPAVRENVVLWINLIGGTGSGKTFTGMRLASGISGGKPFAVIDTENRRALHYADMFKFDHAELRAPFRPNAYAEAIIEADKLGYPAIVIDSGSHVWDGDGGVLDWQEEELTRMAGDDYKKRDQCKMSAWIKPKAAHRHMVSKMLSTKAHVILCLRAAEKIEMKKVDGKMKIVPKESLAGRDGWIPICDARLPFEATCSFLFLANAPGVPLPIKLQEQHRHLFPLDKPINEESGKLIAQWAAGGKPREQVPATKTEKKADTSTDGPKDTCTPEQKKAIFTKMREKKMADQEMVAMRTFYLAFINEPAFTETNAKAMLDTFDTVFEDFIESQKGAQS